MLQPCSQGWGFLCWAYWNTDRTDFLRFKHYELRITSYKSKHINITKMYFGVADLDWAADISAKGITHAEKSNFCV